MIDTPTNLNFFSRSWTRLSEFTDFLVTGNESINKIALLR